MMRAFFLVLAARQTGCQMSSLHHHFLVSANEQEGKGIVTVYHDSLSTLYSYHEISNLALATANTLQTKCAVKKGDVVAGLLPNGMAYIVGLGAVSMLGATFSPCNVAFSEPEILYQLTTSGANCALTQSGLEFAVKAARHLGIQILFDNEECFQSKFVNGNSLKNNVIISACDAALLPFSSGTTGRPKGVILTHGNFASSLPLHTTAPRPALVRPSDTVVVSLPLFHIYGLVPVLLTSMSQRANILLFPKFEESLVTKVCKAQNATFFPTVPHVALSLNKDSLPTSMRMILTAAAALGVDVQAQLCDRLDVAVCQGYGLTEVTCTASLCVQEDNCMGSIGRPIVPFRIDSVDANGFGELLLHGPTVMPGYWNAPEETAKVFTDDGWFRTGDSVCLGGKENNDFLFIGSRLKDVIKVMAHQVAPAELEAVLLENEYVADVGVVGIQDEESGQIPIAYIVTDDLAKTLTSDLLQAELKRFARTNLVGYKRPRRFMVVPEIIRSRAGKILRHKLLETYPIECKTTSTITTTCLYSSTHANVASILSGLLGRPANLDEPFMEAGLDSMDSVEVRDRLSEELNCKLPVTLTFDSPTPRVLVHFLDDLLYGVTEYRVTPRKESNGYMDDAEITSISTTYTESELCAAYAGAASCMNHVVLRWSPKNEEKAWQRYGIFLRDIATFDASFFGISSAEAYQMHPQQTLVLRHVAMAKEDTLSKEVGVYVGASSCDGPLPSLPTSLSPYQATGGTLCVVAGRISYVFGLQGSCCVYDTACSSSLVALSSASREVTLEGNLAVGVNVMLTPSFGQTLAFAGMLSPKGRCHTFDKAADGYLRGEGCAVCKLHSTRHNDCDKRMHGHGHVLSRSSVRQDGRSTNLTAPSGMAQRSLLSSVYNGHTSASSCIDVLESHGTGTALGDPIEIGSVAHSVSQCRTLQSHKSVFGHAEAAAGIGSLVKATLECGSVGNAQLRFLNPMVESVLPQDNVSNCPLHSLERVASDVVGVNSFGFSGTIVSVRMTRQMRPCSEHLSLPLVYFRTHRFGGMETWTPTIFVSAPQRRRLCRPSAVVEYHLEAESKDVRATQLVCTLRAMGVEISESTGRRVLPTIDISKPMTLGEERLYTSAQHVELCASTRKQQTVINVKDYPFASKLLRGCETGGQLVLGRMPAVVPETLDLRLASSTTDEERVQLLAEWIHLLQVANIPLPCAWKSGCAWDMERLVCDKLFTACRSGWLRVCVEQCDGNEDTILHTCHAPSACTVFLPPACMCSINCTFEQQAHEVLRCIPGKGTSVHNKLTLTSKMINDANQRWKAAWETTAGGALKTLVDQPVCGTPATAASEMTLDELLQTLSTVLTEVPGADDRLDLDSLASAELHARLGVIDVAAMTHILSSHTPREMWSAIVSSKGPPLPAMHALDNPTTSPTSPTADLLPLACQDTYGPMVVLLNDAPSKSDPIIMLPSIWGALGHCTRLAARLHPHWVLGIEHGYLRTGDDSMWHNTIHEQSYEYAWLCTRISSGGSLFGCSYGAILVFRVGELAQRLGFSLKTCIAVDPPPPGPARMVRDYTTKEVALQAIRLGQELTGKVADYHDAAIALKTCDDKDTWHLALRVSQKLETMGIGRFSSASVELVVRRLRVFQDSMKMWGTREERLPYVPLGGGVRTGVVLSSGRREFYKVMHPEIETSDPMHLYGSHETYRITGPHTQVVQWACTAAHEGMFAFVNELW